MKITARVAEQCLYNRGRGSCAERARVTVFPFEAVRWDSYGFFYSVMCVQYRIRRYARPELHVWTKWVNFLEQWIDNWTSVSCCIIY